MTDEARVLVAGYASGPVVRLDEPLSFWGGFDAVTGRIIDRHHPQFGECLTGTVVVMSHGRGSSSSAGVLAEATRLGTGPAAIVLERADIILTLGAIAAAELYGVTCPVVVHPAHGTPVLATGQGARIDEDGTITLDPSAVAGGGVNR